MKARPNRVIPKAAYGVMPSKNVQFEISKDQHEKTTRYTNQIYYHLGRQLLTAFGVILVDLIPTIVIVVVWKHQLKSACKVMATLPVPYNT